MARTWTLVTTLSFGGGTPNGIGHIAVDSANNVLYSYSSGPTPRIMKWDGTTETDISAATFAAAGAAAGKGIAWFSSGLYFLWYDPAQAAGSKMRIYKWDGVGTQTWTLKYSVAGSPNANNNSLAADTTRIVYVNGTSGEFFASLDGETWTAQTVNGVSWGLTRVFGLERYSGYSEIVGYQASDQRMVAHSSANDWGYIGAVQSVGDNFMGYGDGYSFFGDPGSTPAGKVNRSSDWGVNLINPSTARLLLTDANIFTISDSSVIMYADRFTTQAWTYNGTTFIEDGTVASGNIIAFFTLGSGTVYCLTDNNKVYLADSSGLFYSQGGIPGAILI